MPRGVEVGAGGSVGFDGPDPREKHEIMRKGDITVIVPDPHRGDISKALLARLLRQAGISREEWERLE
ncbi:MAG: type II toxin-antitoxin system HicA family toxin [Anaerolineae bacterium]|nr:type II toxin-antitoxin system HicA family toxin [Anaerolineae bacterium]